MSSIPTSYSEAFELFEERRKRGTLSRGVKLANNTHLDWSEDGRNGDGATEPFWFAVKLHRTNVVTFQHDGSIVLNSGGWKTVTTKDRMNCAAQNFRVYSDKGVWYLTMLPYDENEPVAYADGITLHLDGTVTGEGEDPKAQMKLRREAGKYAKAYVAALYSGDIPAPSGADCWGCCMVPADGSTPAPNEGLAGPDHMLSHLEEEYYVPSLVVRALKRFGGSKAAYHDLSILWNTEEGRFNEEHDKPVRFWGMQDQIQSAVRRHVCEQLGLGA